MSQITDALPCILPAKQAVHDALLAGSHKRAFTGRTREMGLKAEIGHPHRSIAFLREECTRELATSC